MIVVASGDSFVWGSELADSPHGGPYGYSRSTFPALLAGTNYNCQAYPGNSNKEIASSLIAYIKQTTARDFFVIVCWTWPTRDNNINSDQHITRLQDCLEEYNIPFMFTCADNCIITGKLDYSNWYMFPPSENPWDTMSPRGFYQWAVENKYLIGPQDHPLEQAHIDAAKLMQEKFNELVKKHIQ